MRRAGAIALFLLGLWPGAAHACEPVEISGFQIDFRGAFLVALRDGAARARLALPLTGTAGACVALYAFPDKGALFVDWDEGAKGEAIKFTRRSLIHVRVDEEGLLKLRQWTIYQAYTGGDVDAVQIDRDYRLIPTPYGARVVLHEQAGSG